MLEGLKISVKQFSELSNVVDDTLRFDAEHYQRKYEQINEVITKKHYCNLRDLLAMPVITGHTPSMKIERFYGGKISFVKTDNLRENKIVDAFTDYLTIEGNEEIKSSALKADDVIVTIIGATFDVVGRSAIVRESHLPANINQNIALIRPNKAKINPTYLNAYLNTKYGRGSLHHHSRQTGQVNLNCREVERVLVPLFNQLETGIEVLSTKADIEVEQAAFIYTKAENLLLNTLGLANFLPSTEKINIKSFQDSFVAVGRLDAEYYQLKYEQIEKVCFENAIYTKRVKDFQLHNGRGLQPEYVENGKLNVINSRHILERELDYQNFEKTNLDNWDSQTKAQVFRNDILIYTTGANIGRTQVYLSDEKALASNHVNILRIGNENSVYVAFVLNSKIGRMQTEQLSAGSAQQELYPKDIDNFYVPFVAPDIQAKIEELVKQSFTLKAESKRLLEVAKRAVEIAIEQDENAGITYIKANS